ncbi:Hypp3301 [Branchiostoma lanceolatum]|uniref:Hypp3301 protein n=1 Tax=Branchiostoma lanceolatum TaxID=7740 RepID=A0A8J9ZYT8_BRALA|nr:Hypp3301 [Branchiostoma lanceolatum]
MLLDTEICTLDFGIVLLLILVCFISVAILVQVSNADQGRQLDTECSQTETKNEARKINVQGHGNITVSAGSGSHVHVTTYCPDAQEESHSTERQNSVQQTSDQNSCQCACQKKIWALVPKPVGKPQRLDTKTQKTCRQFIDNFAMLSAKGKVAQCRSIIAKLLRTKTDPDSQVALRHAASLNAINEGSFEKANRLLGEVEAFLPETCHEAEHRIRWFHQKSMVKLAEGKYKMGIVLVDEALPLLDTVAPGCITAWMLINRAWFLTEIAATEDDDSDRRFLMKTAERDFQHAIEHAENEDPKQMRHFQLRVPRFAQIGLALLYLGCRESVDNFKLGVSNVSLDDMRKAKDVIARLDKEGTVCNSGQFRFMMAKTFLYYRLGSYQQAVDLAQEAKNFATEHSFGAYANFADSTVQYLEKYV